MAAEESERSYNILLFTAAVDAEPIKFYVTPGPQKQLLRQLVENGGGSLSTQKEADYRLLTPETTASSDDVYSYKFILDCVKQNKLLDISTYRVPVGEKVVDCIDAVEDIQMSGNYHSGRSKYTEDDDKAILCGLLDEERFKVPGGNKVWRELEQLKLTNHPWQSMRDRYLKKILPNIDKFDLSAEQKQLLKRTSDGANGEIEQLEKSTVTVSSNTRCLRSSRNEDVSKTTLPVEKGSKPSVSHNASELTAGHSGGMSLRSKTSLVPPRISTSSLGSSDTRTSAWLRSESTVHTSTTEKNTARNAYVVSSSSSSPSPKTPSSSMHVQINGKTTSLRGAGKSDNKIERSPSSSSLTSSPMTTRSKSAASSSPEKSNRIGHRVHMSQWSKKTAVVTSDKFEGKRCDAAVQIDSQSLSSSARPQHDSNLCYTPSPLSIPPLRDRINSVVESCCSGTTAVTARSSTQYDTCLESANSQSQDIDDEELDRLARLAHGSPQSAMGSADSPDKTVLPDKSHRSSSQGERPMHALSFNRGLRTYHKQQAAAIAGDVSHTSLDSDEASYVKRRRTEVDVRNMKECPSESSASTRQLAVDRGKKPVKKVSKLDVVTEAESQFHGKVDQKKITRQESASVQVSKSATEAVDGPSGLASRTRSKKLKTLLTSAHGKRLRRFIMTDTDIEASEDDVVISPQESSAELDSDRIASYAKIIRDTAGKLGLSTIHFMHIVCTMNGNVDDAVYWIQHGTTRSGLPLWNMINDDSKLLQGDRSTLSELLQKYSKSAVEDRLKFLSEAECFYHSSDND